MKMTEEEKVVIPFFRSKNQTAGYLISFRGISKEGYFASRAAAEICFWVFCHDSPPGCLVTFLNIRKYKFPPTNAEFEAFFINSGLAVFIKEPLILPQRI